MGLKFVPKFTRLKILQLFRRNHGLEMFTKSAKMEFKKHYGITLKLEISCLTSTILFFHETKPKNLKSFMNHILTCSSRLENCFSIIMKLMRWRNYLQNSSYSENRAEDHQPLLPPLLPLFFFMLPWRFSFWFSDVGGEGGIGWKWHQSLLCLS